MEFSLNSAPMPPDLLSASFPDLTAVLAGGSAASPAVYGVVLNHPCALEGLGARLEQPPYQAPPKGPVMYVKPRNTWVNSGSDVVLPAGEPAIELGATLALVMGVGASKLMVEDALAAVAGCQLALDLSLPHDSYYRPAIREKCFDGSCVLGALQASMPELDTLSIQTRVDGRQVDEWRIHELLRSPAQLLAQITAFMSLNPGDRLLVGVKWQAPQAKAGDVVTVQASGLPALQCQIVPAAENTIVGEQA